VDILKVGLLRQKSIIDILEILFILIINYISPYKDKAIRTSIILVFQHFNMQIKVASFIIQTEPMGSLQSTNTQKFKK
jgi:hypothetical protein